jgi:copper chaperone NosL
MADFYRWEYEYGHELNPDAPIKVPGMAYQPPLIGYKKLLNFGAYSIPDTGGWIFVGVGLVLLTTWLLNRKRKVIAAVQGMPILISICILLLSGCTSGPEEIRYGSEACSFCKMTIMDPKFSSQCITTKGKRFKFDDSHCLLAFIRNGGVWRNEVKGIYFSDYSGNNEWVPAETGFFLESDNLHGPMGGTIAAFGKQAAAQSYQEKLGGQTIVWQDINPIKK